MPRLPVHQAAWLYLCEGLVDNGPQTHTQVDRQQQENYNQCKFCPVAIIRIPITAEIICTPVYAYGTNTLGV